MMALIKSKLNLSNRNSLEEVIPLKEPYLIYIDPSSSCNFKCSFCPTGHKDLLLSSNYKRNIMDQGLFNQIIDQISSFDNNLKTLRLNKIGEPTLNKNLPEMIKYARKSNKIEWIDFATNGSKLTPDLSHRLTLSGVNRINISLEGINEEQYYTNAKIKIDFKEFTKNLKYLFENKRKTEILIKIPENLINSEKEKKYFYDFFGSFCDYIFIEKLSPIWPKFDLEKRSGHKSSDTGQYRLPKRKNDVCSVIFYSLTINSDGTVSACCSDWNQDLIIGDIKKQNIKDIWNSQLHLNLQKLHLKKQRKNHDTCSSCNHPDTAQIDSIDEFNHEILQKINFYEKSTKI